MDPESLQRMLMQNPNVMRLMQKPGMLQKMQNMMSNPALAQNDPDMMELMSAVQGSMGGGGGFGGNSFGGNYESNSMQSHGSIIYIKSKSQFDQIVRESYDKLVVVDWFTTWCGPCKMIAPAFEQLSKQYKDSAVFLKVDCDANKDVAIANGIGSFPTFTFFKDGVQVSSFSGADEARLSDTIEKFTRPPASNYVHFPMKFEEMISFKVNQYDLLFKMLVKTNSEDVAIANLVPLTKTELDRMELLCKLLDNRPQYHQSVVSPEDFDVLFKMLQWPMKLALPALNIIRVLPFHPIAAKYMSDNLKVENRDIISLLLKSNVVSNQFLTAVGVILKTFCNMFSRRALALPLLERLDEWHEIFSFCTSNKDVKIRGDWISLALNSAALILSQNKNSDFESAKIQLITSVIEYLSVESDKDCAYKAVVCLGTLLFRDPACQAVATTLDVESILKETSTKFNDVQNIVQSVAELNNHISTGK